MIIPVPCRNRTVGTQEDRKSRERKDRYKRKGGAGEIPREKLKRDKERREVAKLLNLKLPRKATIDYYKPVPQTDTGG